MERKSQFPHAPDRVVLWAIYPTIDEAGPEVDSLKDLEDWAASLMLSIQPVYAMSPASSQPHSVAAAAAQSYLRRIGATRFLPPVILDLTSNAPLDRIQELDRLAAEVGSPCIAVFSHGRSGLPRWVMGSFSETLLLHSRYPVLFLSHARAPAVAASQVGQVLFATDFSDLSWQAFLHFTHITEGGPVEITLFHSVCLPNSVLDSNLAGAVVIPANYLPSQMAWAEQESNRWIERARAQGLTVRLTLSEDGIGPDVVERILHAAESAGAQLIVMASNHGAIKSFFAGSVATGVFRASRYPVWIYGPCALKDQRADRSTTTHSHENPAAPRENDQSLRLEPVSEHQNPL